MLCSFLCFYNFRVDLSNVTIVWCISFFLGLLKSRSSNFMIYNIDDVFTLNNSKFDDYVDHSELEIKATANIARSTSYLYLQIDVKMKQVENETHREKR